MSVLAGARPDPPANRASRVERRFAAPMLVAALLVVPVVVIEASDLSHRVKTVGTFLNWTIWFAFAAELVSMLYLVPNRRVWLRSHPLEVAIVVLTPPFLPATLGALRLFRLLRLLRIVVVVRRARRLLTVEGVRLAGVLAVVCALGGGAILAEVEPGHHSVWDGVWWSVTTMATVGYGDLYPVTVIGRLTALALMILGIGFFALVTGAVAQRFLSGSAEEILVAEEQVATDVADARAAVMHELRELSQRLQDIERRVAAL